MNLKESGRKIVMLGVVACLLLALSGTTGISAAADSVLYAKPSASGSGNCSDWDNACTLQTALGAATAGEEIWVAAGTHKPTDGIDRTATFQLKNGVGVYGGFAGTETSREERVWTVHETILSGDIGEIGNDSDNSYHVVTGSGTDGTAVLDGFTISGGNANNPWEVTQHRGGGMYNDGGSPTLTNIIFSANYARYGGGMYNEWSSPTLTNVTFSGNSALFAGSGMYNSNSSPVLLNVTFSNNSGWQGVGMCNIESSPTLTNVTFSDNSAQWGGGMFNIWNSSPTLTNVTFSGNSAVVGGGMFNHTSSSPTLTNVTFSGNSASEKGGGMRNFWYSSPTLTNSILWGNAAPDGAQIYNEWSTPTISHSLVEGGCPAGATCDEHTIYEDPLFVDAPNGDLHLQPTSPAIDVGDNGALPADTLDLDGDGDTVEPLPLDLDGNPRIVNGIVDMGAYEVQTASVVNECVQALPDLAFANPAIAPQMRNALENKLLDDPNSVFNLIEGGMIQDAIDKLNYDIRAKADGSLGGNPANDWITDPTAQAELADVIDALVAYLETLL